MCLRFHGIVGTTTRVRCVPDPCKQDDAHESTSCCSCAEVRVRASRKERAMDEAMVVERMRKSASERKQVSFDKDVAANAVELDHSNSLNEHEWTCVMVVVIVMS